MKIHKLYVPTPEPQPVAEPEPEVNKQEDVPASFRPKKKKLPKKSI